MLETARQDLSTGTPIGDRHDRRFRKLRISLTESCQFRCFYCMPQAGGAATGPGHLDAEGYAAIVRALVPAGLRSVRLTGGEPTLRPDFPAIVLALGSIPGIDLSVTTNGHLLAGHLPVLRSAGVRTLNISLDSLDPATFRAITRSDLAPVLDAIRKARELGFSVKLNCVALRGLNSAEIPDLLRFAASIGAELRFLELMRIGAVATAHRDRFLPAAEIEAAVRALGPIRPLPGAPDDTARRYERHDGSRFGIIASETRPFCDGCSRLRLTARGEFRPCLMRDERISLVGGNASEIRRTAREAFLRKPLARPASTPDPMHAIGG